MDSQTPLVSIIMPMKNVEAYVFDAINSVTEQKYQNFELIVIDDGSTDNSKEIVNSIADSRIKLIDNTMKGTAHAVNTALDFAMGGYVCRCDADDLLPTDRLEWQVKWLENHQSYDAVCGNYTPMDSDARYLSEFDCGQVSEDITSELYSGVTRTSLCTFLVKKTVFDTLGGFRPFFVTSQDIDFQLRMCMEFKVWFEPKNSYYYRLHDSSATHTQPSNKRDFFEKTARLFLEQRKEKGCDDLESGEPPIVPDFDVPASKSSWQISGILISEAWRLHRDGQKQLAIQKGWRACRELPHYFVNWKNLFFLIIK